MNITDSCSFIYKWRSQKLSKALLIIQSLINTMLMIWDPAHMQNFACDSEPFRLWF